MNQNVTVCILVCFFHYICILRDKNIEQCLQDKDHSTLLSVLTKAISLYPGNTDYFVKRSDAYLELGDFNSAIANLRHVWRVDDASDEIKHKLVSAYLLSGQALFDGKMYQRSLEKFEEGRKLAPDNLLLQIKCISCLHELEEFNQCMSLIQESLSRHPNSPDLLVLRAKMNLLFGKVRVCMCVRVCVRVSYTLMRMNMKLIYTHNTYVYKFSQILIIPLYFNAMILKLMVIIFLLSFLVVLTAYFRGGPNLVR